MNKKRAAMVIMAVLLLTLTLTPALAFAENDPQADPADTAQTETVPEETAVEDESMPSPEPALGPATVEGPDTLRIDLGTAWAGSAFSLMMDYGEYPGTIVADENGVVTTELGGSKTYTLTFLTKDAQAPAPEASEATAEPDQDPEDTTGLQEGEAQPEANEGIPTMHLVLFVGGLAACIASLVAMRIAKRRRYARESADYDDEDDEE